MQLYYAHNMEVEERLAQNARLHEVMKEEMITQKELSRRTGISLSNLNRILNGKNVYMTDSFWAKMMKSGLNMLYVRYGIKD